MTIINTVYNVPYKNLMITLKFYDGNLFWKQYPNILSDTLEQLLKGVTSLSAIGNTLVTQLKPLGLLSVTCIDVQTGSGMEFIEQVKRK